MGNASNLFINYQDLSQNILVVANQVPKSEADVAAQEVLFSGGTPFTSEVSIQELVTKLDPTGPSFAACCSLFLFFCHNPSYSPSPE